MSNASHNRQISIAEFYAFVRNQARENGRFDLVDGFIVRSMAGASRRHERITASGIHILMGALSGQSRCYVFTPDTYIRIPAGNRRQGDFGIDCGDPPDDSLEADQPRLICEVLSKSNEDDRFDFLAKIEEYRTIPSLEVLVLIDPEQPQMLVHRRGPDASWIDPPERLQGIGAVLELPQWDLRIPLADLYAGLRFRTLPMLVWPDKEKAAMTDPGS